MQRLASDLYKTLNQVNSIEVPDDLKLPDNFTQLINDMKINNYDTKEFAVILKGMVCRLTMVSVFFLMLSMAFLDHQT